MKHEDLILVDANDNPVGQAGKIDVHQNGLLHRAFSIFIFNAKGEMLLQQRALEKYHSGGLWSNACCSHPLAGEEIDVTIQRRLQEEMGFQTPASKIFEFVYKAEFGNGLTEYEYDYVFAGEYNDKVDFNKNEVMDFCFKNMEELTQTLQENPQNYTVWFRLAFPKILEWWNTRYNNKVL